VISRGYSKSVVQTGHNSVQLALKLDSIMTGLLFRG